MGAVTTQIKGEDMKTWKYASASVCGKSHKKTNIPCQDRVSGLTEKDIAVVSLADGAGSYLFPEIGAEVITNTVCNILKDEFDYLYDLDEDYVKNCILKKLQINLSCTAYVMNIDFNELSSTLLFVAVMDNRFIAGHIGDGAIGALNGENVEVLSHPDRGEYANVTYFITGSDAYNHFRIQKGELKDITGFILMSDGAADSLYNNQDKKLSEASEEMLLWLDKHDPHAVSVALENNIKDVLQQYTTDDCSIGLLKQLLKK